MKHLKYIFLLLALYLGASINILYSGYDLGDRQYVITPDINSAAHNGYYNYKNGQGDSLLLSNPLLIKKYEYVFFQCIQLLNSYAIANKTISATDTVLFFTKNICERKTASQMAAINSIPDSVVYHSQVYSLQPSKSKWQATKNKQRYILTMGPLFDLF